MEDDINPHTRFNKVRSTYPLQVEKNKGCMQAPSFLNKPSRGLVEGPRKDRGPSIGHPSRIG